MAGADNICTGAIWWIVVCDARISDCTVHLYAVLNRIVESVQRKGWEQAKEKRRELGGFEKESED